MEVPHGGAVTCCVLLLAPFASRREIYALTGATVELVTATNR